MRSTKTLFLLFLLVLTGCTSAIQMQGIERLEGVPKDNYVTYLYSAGGAERFRAAFLKLPGSDAEVIPYSLQITKTTGTFEDAIAFMQRGPGYKKVDIQSVSYKGKQIGFLLTQPTYTLGRNYIEVNLFESGGKIYFSVWEKYFDD